VGTLKVSFAGRTWPVYPAGPTAWRTVLGTDPTTRPGRQTVTVEAVASTGARVLVRREVTVLKVAFPTRRVTFDPEQAALLTPEAVARERRRVREALREAHPEQLWEDPLLLPIEGVVSSPYGVLSVYQGQTRGFHGGVDFPAPEGVPVRAAGDGIVRLAELLPLSGNAVFVDHGLGVITSYLHMSEISVRPEQRLRKGEVIGRVGSTGLATGPHLHWGLRVNGVRVDPMPWTAR
jgi:murein DD-endopeptidase MepM/ murein hydrolase activator NlpD